MILNLLALAAFASTGLGALLWIREKNRLHFVTGLTAGVLLGVVSRFI